MEKSKIKRNELLGSFATLKTLSDLTMDDSETNVIIAKNIMSVEPVVEILQNENNNKVKEYGEEVEENGQQITKIIDPESREEFIKWSEEFFSVEEEIEIIKIDPSKLKGTITEKDADGKFTVRPIPISGSVLIALKPFLLL